MRERIIKTKPCTARASEDECELAKWSRRDRWRMEYLPLSLLPIANGTIVGERLLTALCSHSFPTTTPFFKFYAPAHSCDLIMCYIVLCYAFFSDDESIFDVCNDLSLSIITVYYTHTLHEKWKYAGVLKTSLSNT